MAKPKFLRVKNYERYQHYSKRNPPWIKLYKEFLTDYDLRQLSIECRFLYVSLLIVASDTANCIPVDLSYLSQRVGFTVSEMCISTLIKKRFLLASRASVSCLHDASTPPLLSSGSLLPKEEEGSGEKKVSIRGSVFPEGFSFDTRSEELAKSYGLNVQRELAAFRDHHVSVGSVFKDWQAAFRTWLRRSLKFAQKGAR